MGTLKHRGSLVLLSGPVMIAVTVVASFFPAEVEAWYSRGLYPWIASTLAYLVAFPFPLAEGIAALLVVGALVRLVLGIYKSFRQKEGRWLRWRQGALTVVKVLSVIVALFLFLWGLNYQRLSWGQNNGWTVKGGSPAQLEHLASSLEVQASLLRRQLPQTPGGLSLALGGLPWDSPIVFRRIAVAYAHAGRLNPLLGLKPSNPARPLWGSSLFSQLGIAGIFIPFTGEPLVNTGPGGPMVAFDAAHEMSHERGWAREDEANFLSFYVLTTSGEPDLAYAGTQAALMYVVSALEKTSPKTGLNLVIHMDSGIKRDWRAYYAYWQRFEGPVEKVAQGVNDAYLKAQGQTQGIRSYGLMVDLLLAYTNQPTK
ncbi:MAG: DUF3810 domain-containing protein [Spirochaetales bacterium]|nr:DUF3810 domain-containing protein [Spirochaetales bacterium]